MRLHSKRQEEDIVFITYENEVQYSIYIYRGALMRCSAMYIYGSALMRCSTTRFPM